MQCTVTFMTDSSLIQYCCYRIIRTTVNHLSIRQVFKMNEDTFRIPIPVWPGPYSQIHWPAHQMCRH